MINLNLYLNILQEQYMLREAKQYILSRNIVMNVELQHMQQSPD